MWRRTSGWQPEQVLLTNGVDEAIHLVCAAFLEEDDEALICTPTFFMYDVSASDDDAAPGEGAGGCDAGVSVRALYGGDYAADEADHGVLRRTILRVRW